MASSAPLYPGISHEAHPEVFDIRAMLPQPKVLKPGQLPEDKIKEYFNKGFLVIEDFFEDHELQPVRDFINQQVETTAQKLLNAGKIQDLHRDSGFTDRLTKLEKDFSGASDVCRKFTATPQAVKDLWTNERLLNLVEQLIGPDIAGNPVLSVRTKIPGLNRFVVPWHQDSSYLDNDTYKMLIVSAWIPIVDATVENGCMEMVEGGHLAGKMAAHQCCWEDTPFTMLKQSEMEKTLGVDLEKQIRTCPIKTGGLLLFSNIIPHRSLPNVSNGIRWSVDFRWQKTSDPAGLWGLKQSIPFRSSKNPDFKPDWAEFDAVSRHKAERRFTKGLAAGEEEDEFDTTVQGPWMKQWEITHVNRHVERFLASQKGPTVQ